MKYAILVIILFCCSTNLLLAQENKSTVIDYDKENYEKDVFNKEFGEISDTTELERKQFDRIPEKLPDWIFQPYIKDSSIRIVGFSDPNLEKEQAIKQATLRAKAIYALFSYSTISNITDDYTNLHESGKYSLYSTKFQDFSLSKAKIPYNNTQVSIIDTFYTKYDESVVLLELKIQNDSILKNDTLEVKGEHLQIFIERNFKKEKIEFFNFFVKDNLSEDSLDVIAQYNFRVVNLSYNITSLLEEKEYEFKERTYNYRTDLDFKEDSADNGYNYFRLTRGLWNGYISGVLSNVTVLSKQLASKVKNSNDFYTLKTEGLIRTVARNSIEFDLKGFKMLENQFYIDLNGDIRQ